MLKQVFSSQRTTTDVVVGANVTMTQQDGQITLLAPAADGRTTIGTYNSAAEAWAALDELDAPFESPSATEAA